MKLSGLCTGLLFAVFTVAGDAVNTTQPPNYGDQNHLFKFLSDGLSYLAPTSQPQFVVPSSLSTGPVTHVVANSSSITGDYLRARIAEYLAGDDVFNEGFLGRIIVSSPGDLDIGSSAKHYIRSIHSKITLVTCGDAGEYLAPCSPEGPYYAVATKQHTSIHSVYRLYEDTYRDFVKGVYQSGGQFHALDLVAGPWSYDLIPVPSRLYSKSDSRPLAGKRFGVKDIYDIEGLPTSLNSIAWSNVHGPAEFTAPSVQRLLDLGAVIIGKQKTAQFASAAPAWEWFDSFYPRNPRGDGHLTCSASSSGGGCSVAAYNWLDFAIGSDTGQSVRQPAAVSGTYGIRPSQGMMSLDGVMPIGFAVDTAGFFARDPRECAKIAKLWYTPSLHQDPKLNRLPALTVQDTDNFPRRILYPVEHLPLQNPAAEAILQSFLGNISSMFSMSVETLNLTETIETATNASWQDSLDNLSILWTHDQLIETAEPLLTAYAPEFPSLDLPFRDAFRDFVISEANHTNALEARALAATAWNRDVLYSTNQSCSESIIVYDIGSGGLPYFNEQYLNALPGSGLAATTGTVQAGSTVCSYFGCADVTLPIGQVSYVSPVTGELADIPVTVNIMVKRGCDFVLFNMIDQLAEAGVLKTVHAGVVAFD